MVAQRPLLVGEAPSKRGDRFHMLPLSGPPARVLCKAAGIPPVPDGSTFGQWTWALYERFECHNLIERYATAYPWSEPLARTAAREFVIAHSSSIVAPVIVCLGEKVATAFRVRDGGEWGVWQERGLLQIVAAPHPSGRSRIMNDPGTRALLGRVLNEAMERARGEVPA